MDNPLKKLASQTAVYGLSSIIGRLLNYLLTPLYTYTFLPTQYGVVVELYTYVSFLAIILTYGMETAFFRFSEQKEDKDAVYSTGLISLLVTTLLFIIISLFSSSSVASTLHYKNNVEYIQWFIFIIALDAFTAIPFAKLRQQNKAKKFAVIRLINIGINIGCNLFFILLCPKLFGNESNLIYNPEIGVGYIFISNLIASIATLLLLLPTMLNIKFHFDTKLWKEMLVYALPLLIAGLAGMVNETMDRVLLKHLLPQNNMLMAQIGIYGACYKIAIIMTIFIQTFRYAAEPFFFSHSKNENAQTIYADVMKYFVIICSFIFLTTMSYMNIVKYFIGEAYREGLFIVPILLLANLFLGVFFNLSIWYKLSGQTKYGAYLTIIGAIITIVANVILIPTMGYAGAAWATLICYATIMLISYFIGQRFYFIKYDLKSILGYLILAVSLYIIERQINTNYEMLNVMINSIFLLIYCAVVVMFERHKIVRINKSS